MGKIKRDKYGHGLTKGPEDNVKAKCKPRFGFRRGKSRYINQKTHPKQEEIYQIISRYLQFH